MAQEIQEVDQKASTALSNVMIKKSEQEEEMRGMRGGIENVHKSIAKAQEQTTVLVSQLQMNVQNQLKTAVSEETFNKRFDQLFNLMAADQQSNIQYQINTRHMDGCLNKHKHAQDKENVTGNTPRKVPMTNVINALGKVM